MIPLAQISFDPLQTTTLLIALLGAMVGLGNYLDKRRETNLKKEDGANTASNTFIDQIQEENAAKQKEIVRLQWRVYDLEDWAGRANQKLVDAGRTIEPLPPPRSIPE